MHRFRWSQSTALRRALCGQDITVLHYSMTCGPMSPLANMGGPVDSEPRATELARSLAELEEAMHAVAALRPAGVVVETSAGILQPCMAGAAGILEGVLGLAGDYRWRYERLDPAEDAGAEARRDRWWARGNRMGA